MSVELVTGSSKCFKTLIERLDYFAKTPWPVLITGETGVGKELLALRLHNESHRSRNPFIPINCAAIPLSLFESELFGYERGAFSGAMNSTRGLARTAHGGTLFLDEIGELDLSLQAKLLRLIESGEVRSVGSTKIEKVDTRIIAATNVNLFRAVKEGRFRLDLLERLSILTLNVPSLKDRKEDIPALIEAIAGRHGFHFEENILPRLQEYDWPGNIRQLRNFILRAGVLGSGVIKTSTFVTLIEEEKENEDRSAETDKALSIPSDGTLEEIERQVIVERLKRCHGNRKMAAHDLGIAKSTLHEKLRRWKMESAGELAWPLSRWGNTAATEPACEL